MYISIRSKERFIVACIVFHSIQTIHEAMNVPCSVLRAIYENVAHEQSRLLEEVQRWSVFLILYLTVILLRLS